MTIIIHIIADANLSGVPIHVLNLSKGLDKNQFRSAIIGPPGPIMDRFRDEEAAVTTAALRLLQNKFNFAAVGQVRNEIRSIAREFPSDQVIIHAHGVRAGLFGRLAARGLGCPVIYSEHLWTKDYHLPNQMNEKFQIAFLRYLDRFTTKTIAVSDAVKEFLIFGKITNSAKIERIYNGIELLQKPLPLSNRKNIGSVGSLTWQKNYSWLIDLLPEISREIPEITIEIIGEGEQENELRAQVRRLGLTGLVKFLGRVPHDKLVEHYKNWGLYVQSSVNESFGLALAEAIAAGLPTLSSNVGSAKEVVGTESALFDLTDKEEALRKIIKYLKNDQLRAELQQKQWQHIQQFSLEAMIKQHEELYLTLLN